MIIYRGIKDVKKVSAGCIATIGVFDGVHVGHKTIIGKIVADAKRSGLKSAVVTFDPHPEKILLHGKASPSLISLAHRIKLIEGLGVDHLIILKFTNTLSKMTAAQFVSNILARKINVKKVYVSEKFYFGRGGASGVKDLVRLSKVFDIDIKIVPSVKVGGVVASSSIIRKLIQRGDLAQASKFLGRRVAVLGTVVKGFGFASALGFPTANINPHHEVIPPSGVYAVKVLFSGKALNGILNIGIRPTFYAPRDVEPTIEVHIFNFYKNIYGKDVEVLFVKKLRNEFKFKNVRDLVSQIRVDVKMARSILAR